jgi:hypothetical protein
MLDQCRNPNDFHPPDLNTGLYASYSLLYSSFKDGIHWVWHGKTGERGWLILSMPVNFP